MVNFERYLQFRFARLEAMQPKEPKKPNDQRYRQGCNQPHLNFNELSQRELTRAERAIRIYEEAVPKTTTAARLIEEQAERKATQLH